MSKIITGIGHDRDESVLDMVSHTRVKTPTAAAAFLIEHLQEVHSRIVDAEETMIRRVTERLQMERLRLTQAEEWVVRGVNDRLRTEKVRIERLIELIPKQLAALLTGQRARLEILAANMQSALDRKMLQEHHKRELMEFRTEAVNPEKLLRKGYSITRCNGRVVRSADQLKAGDEIETTMEKGIVKSRVYEVDK